MLPAVVVTGGSWGRALIAGALGIGSAIFGAASLEVREVNHPGASMRAPWVETCTAAMERMRVGLTDVSEDFAHADVRQAWSLHAASAELKLDPQYSARIEYRQADDVPAVFDWEEAPTPVVGSFALHRHVGHFDLTVVADDSDERGLAFAARMQPLLDGCLMGAQE
jgi:hypothetical protein